MTDPEATSRAVHPTVDLEADLSTLEEERDFLLRSLRDLDAEREANDLDDVDYQTLRDDYTARAADVLRAIEVRKRGGGAPPPPRGAGRARGSPAAPRGAGRARRIPAALGSTASKPGRPPSSDSSVSASTPDEAAMPSASTADGAAASSRPGGGDSRASRTRWRLAAIVTGVLLFGAIAGWAVTATSGSRAPGQSITGNTNLRSSNSAPSGVDSRLTKAASLVNQGKVTDALQLYDQVLADTPNQPEALANSGWLIAQAGMAVTPARPDLVDQGLSRIVAAEQAAPSFADPHFFRGYLLLRGKNDPRDAVTELRTYLGLVDPSSPQVKPVEQLLQQAITAAGPNLPPAVNTIPSTIPPTTAAP